MDSLWLFHPKEEKEKKYAVSREEVFYEEQAGVIEVRAEGCIRKRQIGKQSYSSF